MRIHNIAEHKKESVMECMLTRIPQQKKKLSKLNESMKNSSWGS